jgi:hypothetical protein
MTAIDHLGESEAWLAATSRERTAMLRDKIQAELERLQLHPVNLGVSTEDGDLITLRGSLLQYWKLPTCLDSQCLLTQLQRLSDDAGPQAVMSGLMTAFGKEITIATANETRVKLRLFDAQSLRPIKNSFDVP